MVGPSKLRVFLMVSVLAATTACEYTSTSLRMMVADYRQFDAEELSAIIEEQSNIRFTLADVSEGRFPLEAITTHEADLALVENSAAFVPGARAVLPVYESVLHIAIRDDYQPSKMVSPLQDANFYVANRSVAGTRFVEVVTRRQELAEGQFRVSQDFEEGTTDIIVYFGPINPEHTAWLRPGFSLVSLDNHLNPQREFYRKGIGYLAPNMKPKVIPAYTYDLPGNREALLTVAVDTLLVTHKDVSEATIYELTRTFLEQKPRLTALAPHLFSGINESFDPLDLSFPLHAGARAYLERDDPSFIERYAETINMLVYVSFLLISAFLAFARWREHRKKDRIDVFYQQVMAIRDRIGQIPSAELLEQLEQLEREAFNSLIAEKLAANDSFRIFTDMLVRLRADLNDNN